MNNNWLSIIVWHSIVIYAPEDTTADYWCSDKANDLDVTVLD